ncbi:MAG: hypothetical protein SGILL_008330 [Bacillariaceae sp.]
MNSSSQKRDREVSDSDGGAASRCRVDVSGGAAAAAASPAVAAESPEALLPVGVIAVGAMNNRSRIFVPGKNNTFAGIPYEFVMIDNGCNSLLLPFPAERSVLNKFMAPEQFTWRVSHSTGIGAIRSPTLTIKHRLNLPIGDMRLDLQNGSVPLKRLRFHVDKDAANFLLALEGTDLDSHDRTCLQSFLNSLGENEGVNRRHVLLGQLFLKDKLCIQSDPVFLIAEKNFDGEIQATLAQVQRMVAPMLESFEEFHDVEDDDHNGDDDEEKRRSWGDDDIDEPNF